MDELKMIADLLTEPPPAEQAVTRGRARLTTVISTPPARRRGHRRLAAGIIAATAAAAVVLGVGLSGGIRLGPGLAARARSGPLAFTLAEHANGTATLTINPKVLLRARRPAERPAARRHPGARDYRQLLLLRSRPDRLRTGHVRA